MEESLIQISKIEGEVKLWDMPKPGTTHSTSRAGSDPNPWHTGEDLPPPRLGISEYNSQQKLLLV